MRVLSRVPHPTDESIPTPVSWSPSTDSLRYDVTRAEGRATVRLAGELDIACSPVVDHALVDAAFGTGETIVDLSRVTFIDASGLRLLLTAQRDARAAGRSLTFHRPHPAVRRLLALTGVLPLLEIDGLPTGLMPLTLGRDVVAVCTAAIHRAMRIDRTDKANMQLLDPSTGALRIIAHHGFRRDFLDFFEIVDDAECACGSALSSGRPIWVRDTAASAIFAGTPACDVMLDAGSKAVASVPVRSPNGRLIAMFSTHHNRCRSWTEERRQQLERLAGSTGRLLHELTHSVHGAPA
jgi:anti-anti-sigma factor